MEVRKIAKKTITVIEPKQALLVDKAKYQQTDANGSILPCINRFRRAENQLRNAKAGLHRHDRQAKRLDDGGHLCG